EDVHNNADKSSRTPLQHNHTFTWDNFAFDGPVVARDLSFDVLDSLTACHDGTLRLGWGSAGASQPAQVKTLPLTSTAIGAAQGQFVTFNAFFSTQPTSFSLTLNGHSYKFAWPFPYGSTSQINSFMFPVNNSDLVSGPNAITLWSDQAMVVMNMNV